MANGRLNTGSPGVSLNALPLRVRGHSFVRVVKDGSLNIKVTNFVRRLPCFFKRMNRVTEVGPSTLRVGNVPGLVDSFSYVEGPTFGHVGNVGRRGAIVVNLHMNLGDVVVVTMYLRRHIDVHAEC